MVFLLSIPIALLAIILESYPRVINREYGVDIWTHLLYLKEYHRQKKIPRRIENGFIVSGEYDYPPVFMWLLSKLPYNLVKKYEFLFSPLFDSIHVVLIFVLAYLLTSSLTIALISQLLYVLTPIVILENSSATPRSMGYTLFSVVTILTFYYSLQGNILFFVFAIILGSIIFLSHRFTTQGFLFFSLAFSIFQKNISFLLVFLASFILGVIISRGFYFKVLSGHYGNLYFWKKNIKYRYAHQVKGNLSPKKTKDFIFRLYTQFLKFPPFVLEITNPWLIFIAAYVFLTFPVNRVEQFMLLWVSISYGLALVTIWIPKLRFLGEGQRYLELSAFPTAFLSSTFFVKHLDSSYSMLIVFIYTVIGVASLTTILIIQRKAIIDEKLRTLTPDMKKMFSYLRSLKDKPRLLCVPHQITTNTIYHTGCQVYVNASYSNISKISDVYPYIRKPIRQIMEDQDLDMILLNTDYAKIDDLNLGKYIKVHEEDNFVLLK